LLTPRGQLRRSASERTSNELHLNQVSRTAMVPQWETCVVLIWFALDQRETGELQTNSFVAWLRRVASAPSMAAVELSDVYLKINRGFDCLTVCSLVRPAPVVRALSIADSLFVFQGGLSSNMGQQCLTRTWSASRIMLTSTSMKRRQRTAKTTMLRKRTEHRSLNPFIQIGHSLRATAPLDANTRRPMTRKPC